MLAQLASVEAKPSHFEAAAPFLVTAAVILVGAVLTTFVVARAQQEYAKILDERKIAPARRGIWLQPKNLADMSQWMIDASGLFAGLTGPIIGAILLYNHFSGPTTLLYAAVILLAIVLFVAFVQTVTPRGYPNRPIGVRFRGRIYGPRAVWIFTPVTMLTAIINLLAGVILLLFGP
jgi:uncharacterized membrane protein